jgi:hypothetical protein
MCQQSGLLREAKKKTDKPELVVVLGFKPNDFSCKGEVCTIPNKGLLDIASLHFGSMNCGFLSAKEVGKRVKTKTWRGCGLQGA